MWTALFLLSDSLISWGVQTIRKFLKTSSSENTNLGIKIWNTEFRGHFYSHITTIKNKE